jgi:hypothetical protein
VDVETATPAEDVMTEEAKRQLVILAFTLAGTYLTMWLIENHDPRGLKMRAALAARRVAHFMFGVSWRQVEFWNTVSLAAVALYDKEKN